ncbi:hypothetical protein [Streptosporangium sp. NPDC049046]|uniref:hypothetical protein n=1 Tax=Streptosporangium sp. NPDC049046 TaxID=3155031 RepID=UPI003438FFEF
MTDVLLVHDVVVTRDGVALADLPAGSLIGTSSVRRRAQLGIHRPDLRTERIRGNVDTRLTKLDEDGEYAALILARASRTHAPRTHSLRGCARQFV